MIKKINRKIKSLDIHTLEVLKKSSSSLIVKVFGLLAGLGVSIFLGQTLGAEGLGIINLSNRIVAVIIIFSTLGLNNVIIKEVAIAFNQNDSNRIAETIRTAMVLILPLAIVTCTIFILLSPWLSSDIFSEPKLELPLIVAVIAILPQITSRIFSSGLTGVKKIWQSNLFNETLSISIVFSGLLFFHFLKYKFSVLNVAILYAISRLIVLTVVGTYWNRIFKYKGPKSLRGKSMLRVGLPLLVVTSTSMIAANADSIMLGWLSSTESVGLYSVASRLGLLTNFFLAVTISTLSPKIAAMYADKKIDQLEKMIQQTTFLLAIIGVATLLFYYFFGEWALSLWGNEFKQTFWILIIITSGQLVNIVTGSTGVILMMTGHEKIIGYITIGSAIMNVGVNLILIPYYGILGAAIATSLTVITENIVKVIIVKKRTGILTIPLISIIKAND